jgi:ABC-type transporter Mla MlaB component
VLATIVIDLLNASFIDATGVGALVKAKNKAQAAGLALDVVGVHGQIAQVFALVGFRDHLAGPLTSNATVALRPWRYSRPSWGPLVHPSLFAERAGFRLPQASGWGSPEVPPTWGPTVVPRDGGSLRVMVGAELCAEPVVCDDDAGDEDN